MIRYELIKRISEQFGVEEIEAELFVDGIFESMITSFKKGKKINIPEFGKFNVINKTINGFRQRYVVFSPAKKFADAINKNFSDLEPIVVNALNVKQKDVLKVKEVISEYDDEEYLYFEFDSSEDEKQFEDFPVVSLISEEVIVKEEAPEPEPESVLEDIQVEKEIPVSGLNSDEIFVKEEENDTETITEEKAEVYEKPAEVIMDSVTEQSILIDLKPVIEDENVIDTKPEENIFNEEIAAAVISQQTVFADNPIDIILPDGIPLTEFTENPEDQIAENEKVIDEVNHTTSLTVRVNLKDDMNIDNIKEEILDILVRREEIIKELNVYNAFTDTKHDDILIPVTKKPEIPKYEDLTEDSEDKPEIKETPDVNEVQDKADFPDFEELFGSFDKPAIPPEPEAKEDLQPEDDSDALFTELEKHIRELDELAQKKEELKKTDISSPMSQEMQIFGKLIDDTHVEKKVTKKQETFPEIIIHEPVPEKVEKVESKSLSDALQNMKLDGIIEHLEPDKEVNSYDDVFKNSDYQFKPQYSVESEEKNSQGKFFKGFLYLFFIFLLAAFSFYIYKTMFTKSSGNQVVDTIGLKKMDSVRALLKKTSDSLDKRDTNLAEDESGQTESVEVKDLNGVIYRQLGIRIYIQNKVLDDLAAANELELKLKSNNLNCLVEGTTKIDNGLEYRVLVGPFKNLEDAMEYYEKNKVILNFIQIMHPSQPNLLVF